MVKWKAHIIGDYWWLGIEFPNGRWIPVMRKGRVGDLQHF